MTQVNPANAATGVFINTKLSATFSQVMDPATINPKTFILKQGNTAVKGTVAVIGINAVFIPASYLAANTVYSATIIGGSNGAKDKDGNEILSDYTWSFTTGATADVTPPTVTFVSPADIATGVATNRSVLAAFSEAMDPLSVTSITFTLKQGASTPVPGTVTYSGVTAIFKPTDLLLPSTTYTATITTGASDLTGNALAANFVWSFTTGAGPDLTPPTVTLVTPASAAVNVPLNSSVNATFSKDMDSSTITNLTFLVGGVTLPVVSYNPITRIATLQPASNLAASTLYTAAIGTEVKDLSGNALATPYSWSFTTGTGILPSAVPLGLIAPYGTFGGSAGMTNDGILTVVNGDIGSIATGTSNVTGFHDEPAGTYAFGVIAPAPHSNYDVYTETGSNQGQVNGNIYTCTNSTTGPTTTANVVSCGIATAARLKGVNVYNALALMPSDGVLAGNLAGTTITPGVYTNSSSVLIQGGNLTLDAQGDANAVFVFQIGSTLTVGGPGIAFPQSIILTGGALAKNVFWQVGTSATINAAGGGTMVGNIIAQDAISFSTTGNVTLVTLEGRALSLTSGVTMTNTIINVPTP